MSEKDRQSRFLLTRGIALHVIPRDPRPAGSSELPASKAARNSMQRSLTCGQDPALPVLFTLIKPLKNRLGDFSEMV
jgi:hypothetical protein